MHLGSTIVAGLALGTMFAGQVSAQPAPERMNPLLQPSALPYGVPRFDQIRSDDFRPAFDQGMREELADVDRIAGNAEPPTFANTIEALERSGVVLRRTQRVFTVLLSALSDDVLQKVDAEYSPKLTAHRDAVDLNPQLFARVNPSMTGAPRSASTPSSCGCSKSATATSSAPAQPSHQPARKRYGPTTSLVRTPLPNCGAACLPR